MAIVLSGPVWYNAFDSIPEIISLLIVIAIVAFAYKTYKLTSERKYFYFSTAFFFITLSFFSKIVAELSVRSSARATVLGTLEQLQVISIGQIGFFLTTLLGYMILMLVMFEVHDKRLVALLAVFAFLFSFTGFTQTLIFHLIVALILLVTTSLFYDNYKKRRKTSALIVFISFLLQTVAQIAYAIAQTQGALSPVADLTQMTGFILLLYTFMKK